MQNKTSTIITIVIVVLALIALVWPALRQDDNVSGSNGTASSTGTVATSTRATSTSTTKPSPVVVTPITPKPTTAPVTSAMMTTNVYLGRTGATNCEQVVAVSRTIPKTVSVGRASLVALLMGPTASEKAAGFTTSINPGVVLKSLTITSGVAVANFSSELNKGVAGSCRVQAIRSQITQTLKQFPTVRTVIIAVEGKTIDVLEP